MVLQPTHSQFHSNKQQLRTDLVQRHQHMPTSINKKFVQLYFSFIFPCYILFLSASQFVSTYSSCSILLHSNFSMKLCFCQIELTIKQNPSTTIYNSTLAQILVEYAAAVSSFTFPPLTSSSIFNFLNCFLKIHMEICHSYLGLWLFFIVFWR